MHVNNPLIFSFVSSLKDYSLIKIVYFGDLLLWISPCLPSGANHNVEDKKTRFPGVSYRGLENGGVQLMPIRPFPLRAGVDH